MVEKFLFELHELPYFCGESALLRNESTKKPTGVTFTPVKTIYHCATFRLSFEVLYALKFDKIASTTET